MSIEFPQCTVQINPDHAHYPLTPSLETYSIMDVTACIAQDCWGIYIKRADNSIESILNMYYYYEQMNRAYDIHQQDMDRYEMEEQIRKNYMYQPGLLVEKIACGDTLVIMLHKVQPIRIQATRQSDIDWDITVFIKAERRFSFEPSDIQRVEEKKVEKKIEQYKQIIATLEKKVTELNHTIHSLDSKHKSTLKIFQDNMLSKITLQLENEKLEKQIEQMSIDHERLVAEKYRIEEQEQEQHDDENKTERICCLS